MVPLRLRQQFLGDLTHAGEVAAPLTAARDDVDLCQMARRALNYLRGNPVPERDYECRFELGPLGIPVQVPSGVPPNQYGYDPISLGDTDCRMHSQFVHMREMAGESEPCAVELGVARRCLLYTSPSPRD